jgi:hypothetical protein
MPHPPCAGGLSALGLLTPFIRSQLGCRVATLSAGCERRWISKSRRFEMGIQDALLCCLWKARFPQRRQSVWDFVCLLLYIEAIQVSLEERSGRIAMRLTQMTRFLIECTKNNHKSIQRFSWTPQNTLQRTFCL